MMSNFRDAAHHTMGVKLRALKAAEKILAEQGLTALSLRAIAETAEIGIASIYHYFANKDELLLSLALSGFETLRREMAVAHETRQANWPLGRASQVFFGFAERQPALFALMYDVPMLARHDSLRAAEHEAFQAFQTHVAMDPRFPAQGTCDVAAALWALGRGIAAITSSQPGGRLTAEQTRAINAGILYLISARSLDPDPGDETAGRPPG